MLKKCMIILAMVLSLPADAQKKEIKTTQRPPELQKLGETVHDTTLVKDLNAKPISIFDHNYKGLNAILRKYVVVKGPLSQVNYQQLKKDRKELDKFLLEVSLVKKMHFDKWNKQKQMAFLINAYNAFTLKLIIDNYPVESIKKIGSFFSSPWKKDFFTLLGEKRNLDWIEHDVLRPKYKEPRIHFAVNCASIGCPALRNEAFVADRLDEQLEEQAKLFLRDVSRNYVKGNTLYLSKIFDWFEKDFKKGNSGVGAFVAPYMSDDKAKQSRISKMEIEYTDYDWKLNKVK